jgi:hypothetical protein
MPEGQPKRQIDRATERRVRGLVGRSYIKTAAKVGLRCYNLGVTI